MKRFLAGALAGVTALTLTVGCANQMQQLEPKLELKNAAEDLGATGKAGLTLKAGGNVEDLIAFAKKESGSSGDAFTEDADIIRKIYNSSISIAWDKAGDGVTDDKVMINATIDGVTGTEIRQVDQVAYVRVPLSELAAKFGASTADIAAMKKEMGSAIAGIDTLIDGGWVSISAADLMKLSQSATGIAPGIDPSTAPGFDPAQSEKLAAELRASAETLLDSAKVVRDEKDKNHLIVTTSTVKAYEEGKRLIAAMGKIAGGSTSSLLDEALGSEMEKAPADKPIVMDLWVDNGKFKAFEINFLQFVEGNTGRATLRVEISAGADITAPGDAKKLDLTKIFESMAMTLPDKRDSVGGAATLAELVGTEAVRLALVEGGKPATYLKKAAAEMTMPGVTVKVVRPGVAQVTAGGSVACVTVPPTTSGRPKIVEHAC